MKKRNVTPKLVAELGELQQNAWGRVTLSDLVVDVTFPSGETAAIELQIEPSIILKGQADTLSPGVVYNPEYYSRDNAPEYGEIIAYGINEGKVTQDTIDGDAGIISWKVRPAGIRALKEWDVI